MSYMRGPTPRRGPGLSTGLGGYYLLMGLAFQLIYFGIQSPLRLVTWFHILGWPFYVVLGLLRWVFYPFAVVALVLFLVVLVYDRRR
jgi:hypothetical protein